MTPADIIHHATRYFDATGAEIGEAAPRDADTHEPLEWIHTEGGHLTCSADNSLVLIQVVGTSEEAHCQRGHRWVRMFSPDGWRQVPE